MLGVALKALIKGALALGHKGWDQTGVRGSMAEHHNFADTTDNFCRGEGIIDPVASLHRGSDLGLDHLQPPYIVYPVHLLDPSYCLSLDLGALKCESPSRLYGGPALTLEFGALGVVRRAATPLFFTNKVGSSSPTTIVAKGIHTSPPL
jgi:hypothetical protein